MHMKRRMKGYGRGKRMQIEDDIPHICSGIRLGKTIGSPIGIIIRNHDWKNWKNKIKICGVLEYTVTGKNICIRFI